MTDSPATLADVALPLPPIGSGRWRDASPDQHATAFTEGQPTAYVEWCSGSARDVSLQRHLVADGGFR